MDLSRIEAWTREKLESEAFRRGIRSPEFRTRSELVRLILRDQYGERLAAGRELIALGAKSVANARGMLSSALGAALAVLPEIDALARLRGRLPEVREPAPRYDAGAQETWREPEPERDPEPITVRESEPVAAREPEPAAAHELEPVDSLEVPPANGAFQPEVEVGDRPTVRPTGEPPAPLPLPPVPQAEPRSSFNSPSSVPVGTFGPGEAGTEGTFRVAPLPPPPAFPARAPSTTTFVEEPIRPVSMARLLAAQGHRERSLAIYEELIAQNSEDASLRNEAQALRRGEPAELPPLSYPPEPLAHDDAHVLPDGGDRLWCEGEPTQGLRLRWALSEHGQQRARAVLGREGELAIRLVSIAFDPIRVVRSEITEHGPIDASGEWTAPALIDSARCFAAVGLRHGERFVAVVHARPG